MSKKSSTTGKSASRIQSNADRTGTKQERNLLHLNNKCGGRLLPPTY